MSELDALIDRLQKRLHIVRPVRLIESARLNVPATLGFFKPVILLPIGLLTDLTPRQVELILAHELAHIARHDYVVNLFQAAIESVMFYHPAVWWLSAQVRHERECCCDDVVATYCSDPHEYACALLSLEERRFTHPVLAIAADGGDLAARVRRLLQVAGPMPRQPGISAAAAALTLACIVLPLITITHRAVAEPTTRATTKSTGDGDVSVPVPEDFQREPGPYHIVPKDLITLSISDKTGATLRTKRTVRVLDPDGTITAAGSDKVKITGLTAPEAEELIQKALEKAGQKAGSVKIDFVEARGSTMTIAGAVDNPGEYALPDKDFRLTDALALVGARHDAIREIIVIRRHASDAPERRLKIDPAKLFAGDKTSNIAVHAGDSVLAGSKEASGLPTTESTTSHAAATSAPVLPAGGFIGEYYVGGHVQNAGVYSITGRQVSLTQAIAMAGGTDSVGAHGYIQLVRERVGDQSSPLSTIRVDQLVAGTKEDIQLQPNDQVTVTLYPELSTYK